MAPRRSIQSSEVKMNGLPPATKPRGRKRQYEVDETPSKKKKVELVSPDTVGIVLTVGTGDIGQLGLGADVEEKTRACAISSLPPSVAIAAGGLHSLCLTKEGIVYSWGCNDEGALGRNTTCEEDNFTPKEVELPDSIVQISAGDSHSITLTSDGRVFAWGSFRDNSGPLGFVTNELHQKQPIQLMKGVPIVKIASGNNHLVLLSNSGTVYTSGCGEAGQLGRIAEFFANRNTRNRKGTENLLDPQQIKVFKRRRLVLFNDIWAGGDATFMRATDTGDIYGCGLNNYHQLGDEDTNMKFQPVLLRPFKGKQWKMMSSGQHHAVALDEDGKLYSMGRNEYGRLGLGENSGDAQRPTLLKSLEDKTIVHISAGESVSFAVTDTGEGFGFGMGTNYQLSQGDDDDKWLPTLFTGKQLSDKHILTIEAGGQHTMILAKPK